MRPRAEGRTATRVAILATLVAAAAIVYQRAGAGDAMSLPEEHSPRIVPSWSTFSQPADSGVVRVVVFSDYRCSLCAVADSVLSDLHRSYPSRIRITWRHYPLFGPESRAAAMAAECARQQGHFRAVHQSLLHRSSAIGDRGLNAVAAIANVPDSVQFANCLARGGAEAALKNDMAAARDLSVRATPTLLLDSLLFEGMPPVRYLMAYLERSPAAGN